MKSSILINWLAGFIIATAGIWAMSPLTTDSPIVYVWDSALERYVAEAGVYRKRSEGYATTHTGRLGINGIPDVTLVQGPKVAIWGDSYVDARHVADDRKMSQVASRLFRERFGKPITAVAIAMEGWSMADICHQLPRYEKLCGGFEAHVIVFNEFTDFDIGQPGRAMTFRPGRPAHLAPNGWHPRRQRLKAAVYESGCNFAWLLLRDLAQHRPLRFAPGKVRRPAENSTVNSPEEPVSSEGRAQVLDALRATTERPILLVYVPALPGLYKGAVVDTEPFPSQLAELKALAKSRGMGFIDIGPQLAEAPRRDGRFPRGFANTLIYAGHLNTLGHHIVAQAIVNALQQQYALHTD